MEAIDKIVARATERQNRFMKFGDKPPLAATLIQDACKQMIHKNYAAAYECMMCALDELANKKPEAKINVACPRGSGLVCESCGDLNCKSRKYSYEKP